MTYNLNSDRTAVVAPTIHWLPIDDRTPRGVSMLLINRASGVLQKASTTPMRNSSITGSPIQLSRKTDMQVKIKKLHPDAIIPQYATQDAACFDLHALTIDGFNLIGSNVWSGYPVICDTGLAFEIPKDHVMLVFSRSGHGFKSDVRLANCTGIVDADFRGGVCVKLTSDKQDEDGSVPFHVKPGDRIAQAMIIQLPRIGFVEVEELTSTERGAGGFGHTGA